MTEGRIVEQGPVANIFTAPGADCTRQLLPNTPSIEVALGHVAAPSG
jgi:ABC-type dipeptide/oligopeptide/nickel transport system ATPase component